MSCNFSTYVNFLAYAIATYMPNLKSSMSKDTLNQIGMRLVWNYAAVSLIERICLTWFTCSLVLKRSVRERTSWCHSTYNSRMYELLVRLKFSDTKSFSCVSKRRKRRCIAVIEHMLSNILPGHKTITLLKTTICSLPNLVNGY